MFMKFYHIHANHHERKCYPTTIILYNDYAVILDEYNYVVDSLLPSIFKQDW